MVYDLLFDQNIILNVTGNTDGCRDDFDALFGFGFYIDHYSRNVSIQNNTVSGATVHGILYQNSTGQISNNTLYNNSRTYPYIGAQIYLTGSPTLISSMTDNILFGLRSQAFTLGTADANRINSADYNFYFNPYRPDSIYVSGSKTLTTWQNLSGQDSHSKEAWYSLSPGDPPRSTLFVNSKNEGDMINLGDRAYRDVDQERYFGHLILRLS
jgi:parallel beta-helix repeat protein